MARYTCPSCGASYNGKRCRQCNYEHFSEEIAHGGHIHQGEPLVIDSPVRRPIPRKDPFDCDRKTRKRPFGGTRQEKKKHPIARFLGILLVIYSLLPALANWGLELETREERVQMEQAIPENLVTLYEEGNFSISVYPDQISDFEGGLRLWVQNRSDRDVYVIDQYAMVNGYVMPGMGVYVDAAANAWGMDTLYLDEEALLDAGITEVQELVFALDVIDDDTYQTVLTTYPIGLSTTGRPLEQEKMVSGEVLVDETDFYMEALGYAPDPDHPRFENGSLKFYLENRSDVFLTLSTLEASVGEKPVDLYLGADLPAHSRAVVRLDLWGLEALEFSTPSELEELTMTLELWDLYDYSGSVQQFEVTTPLVRQ